MREKSLIQTIIQKITNIVLIIAFAWLLVHSFLSTESVSGHSMEPTLSSYDLVLVDTLKYKFFNPSRLDVVIFKKPDSTESIKRVVGLPGETIVIQNGCIYIDGNLLEDAPISDISIAGIAAKPIQLKDDEYFVIGDNADSSEDSRFTNVGSVHRSWITGKIWFKLKPFKKIGLVK